MKNLVIAIDGYSACGKSTTAKLASKALNFIHIDTGAMYRAIALYMLRHDMDPNVVSEELLAALPNIHLEFDWNDSLQQCDMLMDGENVEEEIRGMAISRIVSEVSALKPVREALVALQQKMGAEKNIIMDGRDIGTVVFPNAHLKFFMTASLDKRIERRQAELEAKGVKLTWEEVGENVRHRDRIDTTRKESPLRQAEDAIILDTTEMTIEDQVEFVCAHAKKFGQEKKTLIASNS